MLNLDFKLQIGKFSVPHIVRAEWKHSRSVFVQEFSVILPPYKNIDEVKKGERVKFFCGYKEVHGENLPLEFEGLVYEIGAPNFRETDDSEAYYRRTGGAREGRMIEIKARDPLYELNFVPVSKIWKPSNKNAMRTSIFWKMLSDLVGLPIKMQYDPHAINQSDGIELAIFQGMSVMKAFVIIHRIQLNGLGLDIYYRDGAIVLRDPGDIEQMQNEIGVFVFGKNIIDDELFSRPGSEIKVRVRGYNQSNGYYIESTYPTLLDLKNIRVFNRHESATGEYADSVLSEKIKNDYTEQLFDLAGVTSIADAKRKAMNIWEEIAGEGFQGWFSSFGYPSASIGDVIAIRDPSNRLRSGLAIVDAVEKKFDWSSASYSQKITPGYFPNKAANGLTQKTSASTETKESIIERLSSMKNGGLAKTTDAFKGVAK